MRGKITLFILGLMVWLLLTWPVDAQHLLIGLAVSAFVAFLTGDMFMPKPHRAASLVRYLWFCYYVPVFLWECLKANIDVASRVLRPGLPIKPGIVKVKTSLKSDAGLTFLANSITLTPGTFCVDLDKEKGLIYIHWIDVRSQDIAQASQMIVNKFEAILKRIFE